MNTPNTDFTPAERIASLERIHRFLLDMREQRHYQSVIDRIERRAFLEQCALLNAARGIVR